MQLAIPDLANQAREAARVAFARAGGINLARRVETDPTLRMGEVAQLVELAGLHELRPREVLDELLAAGEVCRAAGSVALPYPLVSMLARPPGYTGLLLLPVGGHRADHGDVLAPSVAVEAGGTHRRVSNTALASAGRLGPFLANVRVGEAVNTGTEARLDGALWLILSGWWVYGAAERAFELAVKHVNEREQFGAPLARLQSVRFRIADIAVGIRGLGELACYTAWRFLQHPADAVVDSLALRVVAQETAQAAFKTAHQLHGATGFCDEHDLSVLSRHVQPYLRLPLDHESSVALLAESMDLNGFAGLFGRYR